MKTGDSFERRLRGKLSRRQFLGAAGVGSVALLSGIRSAEGDETLPAAKFLLEWGQSGKGEGEFSACVGIVDQQDRVWVSATNNRVQQFTNDGKYLRGVGGAGTEPGRFHLPPKAGASYRESPRSPVVGVLATVSCHDTAGLPTNHSAPAYLLCRSLLSL